MNIKDFTTGIQHIGIPTNNIEDTINFYLTLGFTTALRTINGTEEVAFLQLHNLNPGIPPDSFGVLRHRRLPIFFL